MQFADMEKKRQQRRQDEKTYRVTEDTDKPKYYVLDMFPYPSGAGLHVGHPKGYIATDVLARKKIIDGHNVLHPMGFDAFGLPAEQYAIKHKVHPKTATDKNVNTYKKQLESIGFTYDRSRDVNTTDPKFYKWSQRIFIQLYKHYFDHDAQKAKPIEALREKLQAQGLTGKELEDSIDNRRLAYVDHKPINRCPSCKTGLAQEDLEDGKCERCGSQIEQKPMRQWVLRITDYAERLLDGLDNLPERPNHIKDMQRNWIGKSIGTELDFAIEGVDDKLTVYTTRIDTVYGVSYLAIAPEHPLVDTLTTKEHQETVQQYIEKSKHKSQLERTDLNKDKIGVFTGSYAINPFNDEKIPVWIADYVLTDYGTGAVMAVPAHDERDYEFAKKYDLPIKEVVASYHCQTEKDAPKENIETLHRPCIDVILENQQGEFLIIKEYYSAHYRFGFVGGGIEDGETELEAVTKEIIEETGYTDFEIIGKIPHTYACAHGFRHTKQKNQCTLGQFFHVKLTSNNRIKSEVEAGHHDIERLPKDEISKHITPTRQQDARNMFLHGTKIYTEKGIVRNSDQYNRLHSDEAATKMQNRLEEQGMGRKKVQYKLQDRVFSRQRYRGEPIPMLHTDEGVQPLNESELPLELPPVDNYEPTGTEEGPLANIKERINVKLPNGTTAKRESNTMPQRAGSSRYWLRYMDPHNDNQLVDPAKEQYRGQVDTYVGGLEHATRHLIYGRFWHQFLYDIGVVSVPEPFKKLYGVGLVMAEDGRKMSKRRGNVINPDDVIAEYGADAFRTYEMFMGPFENEVARSTAGVKGVKKFLDKVWKLADKTTDDTNNEEALPLLHQTIKKVTDDIENFRFNTAISQLMILVNELSNHEQIDTNVMQTITILLAPFAPHMAEELREKLGNEFSIFTNANWPIYDESLLAAQKVTLAVQFNGKVRGTIEISPDASENDVMDIVKDSEQFTKYLDGNIVKIIYVPKKILNIVIK